MRLSKVRLAGFKSFVDPTSLVLPGNLVGVVGPNGCGKSNVIDAVRWVMGESSARHLRGDSMADVIFNGSTSRKPVGQATIELLFDNSDGSLGDRYARYAEIAVKRQISRDGQSVYFLNGTRCRRRDITDLFAGTGLGPRSYAIIEQGMISRVVEARPEDLRVFIEEAAGISRYKERRRETEQRIEHTRENLARLGDLRGELERQLQNLGRQARIAERYSALKQEERQLRAQTLAMRFRDLEREATAEAEGLRQMDTALQANLAGLRHVEAALEAQRAARQEAADQTGEVQSVFYAVGAEIARLEQAAQHSRQRREELARDLERLARSGAEAEEHLERDRIALEEVAAGLAVEEPAWQEAQARELQTREELLRSEAALQDWQRLAEDLGKRHGEPLRQAEVERTRGQNLEDRLTRARQRIERLEQERRGLDLAAAEAAVAALQADAAVLEESRAALEAAVREAREEIQTARETLARTAEAQHRVRAALQSARGRLASLETVQDEALNRRHGAVAEWLSERNLQNQTRLAEDLEVAPGWEAAVETVLGHHLEAVCVGELGPLLGALEGLRQGVLGLYETAAPVGGTAAWMTSPPPAVALQEKVRAPWPLAALLAGVYTAASLEEALAMRGRLGAGESLVTPEGIWLGTNWLRVNREQDVKSGVLAREHELKELRARIEALAAESARLDADQGAAEARLKGLESGQAQTQARLNEVHRNHAQMQSRLGSAQARLEQLRARTEALRVELAEYEAQREAGLTELVRTRTRLEEALQRAETLAAEQQAHQRQRTVLAQAVEQARLAWQGGRDGVQTSALRLESLRTRREALAAARQRARGQAAEVQRQREERQRALEALEAPLAATRAELERQLARRVEVEAQLRDVRRRLADEDARGRELEQTRQRLDGTVAAAREALENSRVAHRATEVRRQTVLEQLEALQLQPEEVVASLPPEAAETLWQERLAEVERRIGRLGPINLAAVDELAQQSERKQYLDAQHEDLSQSLETLQGAIRKIDRETRNRFQETFERVNEGFRHTFPRLFGGGQAYLELTGEDLLETGISVMARPPGKRNSSIHLLSGGEKALTAVALVFAIFELNPAPFCLLDEVDAPLDDANVGRFCALVKSMADRVQFLFITHNKSTMELADHLVGVTMHEPGVSRLVQVDVEEAVAMAAR